MSSEDIEQQFEETYRLQVKAVFRFAYFKVSHYETALDLTQDTFLKFWKALSKGQPISNAKALLFFIAHGLIVDYYRRKNFRTYFPLESADEGLIVVTDDVDKKLDRQSELNRVLLKLWELKNEHRDVLILYYIEDIPVSDIAAILEKNENAVRVLIHRALKELKGKL